jgi:hypothetical protein
MRTKPPDITSPKHTGQTWNDCPECGKSWETIPPIKGVIHRTKLCDNCAFWHESEPDKK